MKFDYSRIELGTVNFGLNYGITNKNGRLKREVIEDIVKYAASIGINTLDTANNYGDSQIVLKSADIVKNFYICTKVSVPDQKVENKDLPQFLDNELEISMQSLGIKKLFRVLIHNPEMILRSQISTIIEWMQEKKSSGVIQHFGLSVYGDNDIDTQLLLHIDSVQLPLSLYNQSSIESGLTKKLEINNCKICVRSIFLQGLLLQESYKWPLNINQSLKAHHSSIENVVGKSFSDVKDFFIAASFKLALATRGVESVVIGVTTKSELEKISTALEKCFDMIKYDDLRKMKWDDTNDLDPRFW